MKLLKTKIKSIDRLLAAALTIVVFFVLAIVLSISSNLAVTMMTNKPMVEAAAGSCGVSGTDYLVTAWGAKLFSGSYCKVGSINTDSLDTTYGSHDNGLKFFCTGTNGGAQSAQCYGKKMCRVCEYGSGNPCPWKNLWTSPGNTPGVDANQPCGGKNISLYNCGIESMAGCGDAFCNIGASGPHYYNSEAELIAAG